MNQETVEDLESIAEGLKRRIKEAGGVYSETLLIQLDNSLQLPTKTEDPMVSLFVHIGNANPETLMDLAMQVMHQSPKLHFVFEKDPEGKWIKYTVTDI